MSTEWIKPMQWNAEGSEPSKELRNSGFQSGYKPPADTFNYFLHKEQECIEQLQEEVDASNTAIEEQNKALSEAISEDKKAWQEQIKTTNENLLAKGEKVVNATSTDGVEYTATVDGITELYNGMEITIIPSINNSSKAPTLNVNGLGAVRMYRPLSFATFVATAPEENFIRADTPCRLMYHANYATGGIWLLAEKQKTSAQDLYGTVPITSGGTGANTLDGAKENLGITAIEDGTTPVGKANGASGDLKSLINQLIKCLNNEQADTLTGSAKAATSAESIGNYPCTITISPTAGTIYGDFKIASFSAFKAQPTVTLEGNTFIVSGYSYAGSTPCSVEISCNLLPLEIQ